MIQEFKAFIARGNVLDLAVAVIIGAAFGKIVSSLTDDIIMPVIGAVTGGVDFSSHFIRLSAIPAGYTGAADDYAALHKAGVVMLGWGSFLTAIIQFVILAFVIFMLVRAATKAMPPVVAAPAATPEDVVLLGEIRDLLKARG